MNTIKKMKSTFFSFAILITAWANAAVAAEIVIASSPSVPPFIVQGENGAEDTGIEIDIARAALNAAGHTVKFQNLPYTRALAYLKAGRVDGSLTISATATLDIGSAVKSDIHLIFDNVAMTLEENNLEINSIDDLADKSIIAFNFAKEVLGEEYTKMANANPNYRQMLPNTKQIPPTLHAKRAQVAIIEETIYKYHLNNETYPVDVTAPITIHRIFPRNPFTVAFKDVSVRDDFNKGLAIIKENGTYQKIFESYTGKK